jgi:putative tryptophan/tyrosine transport system substrate-binding protein
MRRREFIVGLGSATAWPLSASAQRPALPVVGFLYSGALEPSASVVAAFRKGLSETGYVEGRNVAIEYLWAQNERARLPELAANLVRSRAAVIVTLSAIEATLAGKAATTAIPIVFSIAVDPVQAGLVPNLNRPGGNLTGVTTMNGELGSKRFGLLRELVPGAARFAVLLNPTNSFAESLIRDAHAAASAIGRPIEIFTASTNREIDAAFASLVQWRADALLISPDPLFSNRRVQLAAAAARYAVPAMYPERQFAEVGGLMSYSSSVADQYRQAGIYTGRILKGEKPVDLPVMQPTKFEFVINLKTAKALGLAIPETLLATADEVIQ